MGSCFSQPDKPKVTSAQRAQIAQNVVLPKVAWEVDETWAKQNGLFRQMAVEAGVDASAALQSTMFKRATDFLNRTYPDCARVGSAEDMGEMVFATTYGRCRYPTKSILTLDDNFTGVVYGYAIIIDVSAGGSQKWPEPGAWLDSPDIEGAKQAGLKLLAIMNETSEANTKHVVLRIFIGADLVTCKFDAANAKPTITKIASEQSKEFIASTKELNRSAQNQPDQWRGLFRSMMFLAVLKNSFNRYPGCTVWDEGELRFNVGNEAYPHPTRLLVARRFDDMSADVEATHFKVTSPISEESDPRIVLLRNSNLEKDPGGILAVSLVVSVAESEPWPLTGTYTKSVTMLAAVNALASLVQQWNKEGRVQRCLFQVHMGADLAMYKLVGEKFNAVPTAQLESINPTKGFSSLDAFYIKLEEQKKHELFQSESQFQAIKREINERRAQNPERYDAMMPMIALDSATTFLQMNFPGCDVSDEGEFPATINGQIVRIANTRLVVAKEKDKEKHNVVAALHVVVSPNGEGWAATGKSWLNTKEMKAADFALLELLKQWYVEEKIAEDCMAQVVMGMDATIYRFVDGDRFEDYSEERMAQIRWG